MRNCSAHFGNRTFARNHLCEQAERAGHAAVVEVSDDAGENGTLAADARRVAAMPPVKSLS